MRSRDLNPKEKSQRYCPRAFHPQGSQSWDGNLEENRTGRNIENRNFRMATSMSPSPNDSFQGNLILINAHLKGYGVNLLLILSSVTQSSTQKLTSMSSQQCNLKAQQWTHMMCVMSFTLQGNLKTHRHIVESVHLCTISTSTTYLKIVHMRVTWCISTHTWKVRSNLTSTTFTRNAINNTLLYSCNLFSWYTSYFMASTHCVLLINLIHVFSYGLKCTTYMMNNMHSLYHVRMTVSRTVTVPKYALLHRVMLRHCHTLHKVLARRTLDGNWTLKFSKTCVFTTIALATRQTLLNYTRSCEDHITSTGSHCRLPGSLARLVLRLTYS